MLFHACVPISPMIIIAKVVLLSSVRCPKAAELLIDFFLETANNSHESFLFRLPRFVPLQLAIIIEIRYTAP